MVYEVVNVLTDAPLDHIDWMGFGKDKDKFLTEPTILGLGVPFFAQSMHMIADGLGVTIDEVTAADVKAATATEDIPHELGRDPAREPSPPSTTSGRPGWTASRSSSSTRIYTDRRSGQARSGVGLGQDAVPHRDRGGSTDRTHAPRRRATRRHDGPSRLQLDGDGRHQRDPRRLRRRRPAGSLTSTSAWSGPAGWCANDGNQTVTAATAPCRVRGRAERHDDGGADVHRARLHLRTPANSPNSACTSTWTGTAESS